ncbi:MAG: hypothetical protein ACLP9K_00290 [Nitrososphaerales archaeon]
MTRDEKLQCPECGKLVDLNSLRPVFKEGYIDKSGKLDVPTEMLVRGGWLNKILAGMACPKCGKIIGEPD